MRLNSENSYATLRGKLSTASCLRDENDRPSERLLQAVWLHQRLRRDRLKTTDGRTVRVFHPGFASVEGGPDFRGAVIQIGNAAPHSGDVEVDLRVGNWHVHRHDRNPNFKNVLLHVVWDEDRIHAPASPGMINLDPRKPALQPFPPALVLRGKLDAPLGELALWLENEMPGSFPERLRGRCCVPLQKLDETRLTGLLHEAAGARFQAKAAFFRARAQLAGWEQSLWEGLFCALGYKYNTWPMQYLAETRRRWTVGVDSVFAIQARLYGVSGLLPWEWRRTVAGGENYLQRIWDCWWRERDEFSDCTLPRAAWKFHSLRPANHPRRRLALAAHWLASGDLVQRLERWCAEDLPDPIAPRSLRKIFEVEQDEFWSWHWSFGSARLQKPQPLLGEARVTDLAVNVVLPWLWMRAVEGKNPNLQRILERRYFTWPPAQDNLILRLARRRLLDPGRNRLWQSASAQQGLMQITHDFCRQSNAVCAGCRFPELVSRWRECARARPRSLRMDYW